MNNFIKYGALAAFVGAGIGNAFADTAETKGGLTIKTDDGRFEAKVGGRINFDSNIFSEDDAAPDGIGDHQTGVFFRRARITLEGKLYGWTYKFENDFAGQDEDSGSGFREMWVGTKLGSANIRFGSAKPYRSMEELTSSNEILFMERPFSSATGIYAGRQFQLGAFLDGAGANWGWGISGYNLKGPEDTATTSAGAESSNDTDGVGASGRVYFAPVITEKAVFHIGGSVVLDSPDNGKTVSPSLRPFGRKGPSVGLSAAPAGLAANDEHSAYGLELAGKAGPFYAQAEYVINELSPQDGESTDIDTYYLQASWLLTGETKPYDIKKGVFKNPKPNASSGAWEFKVRYDVAELDTPVASTNPDRDVTQLSAGFNWYANPNVRVMIEYIDATNEPDGGTEVSGSVVSTRLQLSF